MTVPSCPVYRFRSPRFSPSGETVVSVAPLDRVVGVYGGGGLFGEGGLSRAFGRAAVFRTEASQDYFAGVWGARNASRFRSTLRAHMPIVIHDETPNALLMFWGDEPGRKLPADEASLR